MSIGITYIRLSKNETSEVNKLIASIIGNKKSIKLHSFLENAAVLAHELPRRIRKLFYDFKTNEYPNIITVRGYNIDQSLVGRTPCEHREAGKVEKINRYEVLHILFSALLGEPFSWTTIQNGYIINDVMPIVRHHELVASSGSSSLFDLHTEDAFHICAGDYLGLLCLRNPYNAKTIFSSPSISELSEDVISVLFQPRFIIGANIAQNVPEVKEPSTVFFGNRKFPYLRINLNSTRAIAGDSDAEYALKVLKNSLRKNSIKVSFESGDFCYIDNYRVVHGRERFIPNYDGKDRWLKRLYITSCLRKSAAYRNSSSERVINP